MKNEDTTLMDQFRHPIEKSLK